MKAMNYRDTMDGRNPFAQLGNHGGNYKAIRFVGFYKGMFRTVPKRISQASTGSTIDSPPPAPLFLVSYHGGINLVQPQHLR